MGNNILYNYYKKNINKLYFYSFILISIGLLFSRILISTGFFLIFFNWIFEGNFKLKFELIKKNKVKIFISLIFFIYVAGLINTSNLIYGLAELKIKLPLLLPIFYISAIKLNEKQINAIFHFFIVSVFFSTIFAFIKFQFFKDFFSIEDIYEISIVGLNLHLSLLVNFAICLILYYIFLKKEKILKYDFIYLIIQVWFILFLFILNSLTGYFVFFSIVLINVIYVLIKIKINKFKILIISILMLFILIPVVYTISIINDFYKFEKVDFKNLEKITISGNNYYHNLKSKRKENGNIIDIYICKKELEQEWNKKSELKFNNLDKKNQQLSETIIRYLSSKGLRKDSSGISKLTKKEIKYIENGCANYLYINKFSIKSRIYHIIWQIDTFIKTGNATGQSISQRVEFYKSSISLIKKNFWFGVGTGDVMDESKKELSMISSLEKGYRNRVHNQFLVVFTGLGLFGFILFFVFLFYPVLKYKLLNNYLFLNFFTIVLVSFFSVNTLETQLGVSFFSFFYTLLFYNKEKFEKAIF